MNTVKISDICDLNIQTLKKSDILETILYLDTANITENKIDTIQEIKRIDAPSRAQRKVKNNTIIYSTVRPNQKHFGILKNPKENMIVSTGFTTLDIKNSNIIDAQYLFYALTKNDITAYLSTIAENSVSSYPSINPGDLGKLELNLPDLPTQKKIADVLSCIDDKIALNNKTNSELENMAKTVYDYWFTQFDFPDANGKPYKSSGGKMEYNEVLKREIPAGWEVKNIQNCCKIIDCLHSKKPDYCFEDEHCYLLQLENLIDLKLIDLSNKYYVSKEDYKVWTSKTKVKKGDLVVTNAGRVGGVSRIPSYIETGIGRNMTSIRPTDISEYVLCYFFSSTDCDNQIKANTDQGAFFQSLNVKGIKQLNLTIPPKELQKQFDDFVGKMRLQIETNHQQNEELTKLRDYLLPLLMNGQIEVK